MQIVFIFIFPFFYFFFLLLSAEEIRTNNHKNESSSSISMKPKQKKYMCILLYEKTVELIGYVIGNIYARQIARFIILFFLSSCKLCNLRFYFFTLLVPLSIYTLYIFLTAYIFINYILLKIYILLDGRSSYTHIIDEFKKCFSSIEVNRSSF